jgi:hypothetical protein
MEKSPDHGRGTRFTDELARDAPDDDYSNADDCGDHENHAIAISRKSGEHGLHSGKHGGLLSMAVLVEMKIGCG